MDEWKILKLNGAVVKLLLKKVSQLNADKSIQQRDNSIDRIIILALCSIAINGCWPSLLSQIQSAL